MNKEQIMNKVISLKEFYLTYANTRYRSHVVVVFLLSLISVIITTIISIYNLNYVYLIDAAVLLFLSLGIYIYLSRLCSLALFIYGCINLIINLIDKGEFSGWLIAFIGLLAIRTTFKLHFDYKKYLNSTIPQALKHNNFSEQNVDISDYKKYLESTIQSEVKQNTDDFFENTKQKTNVEAKRLIATIAPFICMFIGIAIIYLPLMPSLYNMLIAMANNTKDLLNIMSIWYILIIFSVVLATLLTLYGTRISIQHGMKTVNAMKLAIVCLIFPIGLGSAMIVSEDVFQLLSKARADVKQINTNKLNEIKVFINPKTTTQRFEGPFSSGQMDSIAVYGVISEDTNYKWLKIKVPLCLNFKLDQNKIFKAGKSVAWNRKNAKQYLVRYTDQFKLVVSIEPIN